MLDLFCGRFGWSKAFAARGWECVGVDLVAPPEIPEGCTFIQQDILDLSKIDLWSRLRWSNGFDFICASSPCEQFSVHGMKCFHPNPRYPELGIRLFNHTRSLCEQSGIPYVMENVRLAQNFVGRAQHHCGPFYLWGSGVPVLMPQGIKKGFNRDWNPVTRKRSSAQISQVRCNMGNGEQASIRATIPDELAACVADYAGAILDLAQ